MPTAQRYGALAKFRALIVDKLHEEQAKLTTLSTEVF
jgi:transposase